MSFVADSIIKICVSVLCGCILGIERRSRSLVIGMRTLVLICVSTTLLSILSAYMATNEIYAPIGRGDPTRIASGVINGIGFLGGGAIMKQGLNIKGLTSAAIIWTAATFGLLIGAGLYIQVGVALAIIMILLVYLEKVETRFWHASKSKTLHICFENKHLEMDKIRKTIENAGMIIVDMNMSRMIPSKTIILHYSVKASKEYDYSDLIKEMKHLGNLTEFSITD